MNYDRELNLNLPEDLLVPKGDALLIKLKDHLNGGGKVRIHIKDQDEKTISTEKELFEITAPYTNQ
ncbi:MAG TPA: hypothetical protein VKX33_10130 [Cyclobacteriaceae bacterium]|nr:hypothetical protein [Cyclobacteriaceae bacterium]